MARIGELFERARAGEIDSFGGILGTMMKSSKKLEEESVLGYMEKLSASQLAESERIRQELEREGRPEMKAEVERLSEVAELAQSMSREGMPQAQREAAETDILRTQMAQLGAMGDMGAGLRGLGTTQAQTGQQFAQLAGQDAAIGQQNQRQYLGALSNLGGAEARAESFNELQPYLEKVAEMQALKAAGMGMEFQSVYFPYQVEAQNQQQMVDLAGNLIGAGANAAPAIAASDMNLKENVSHTGVSQDGHNIYEWNYIGDSTRTKYTGVMAQELLSKGYNEAVIKHPSGYLMVDYSKIDVDFNRVD